MFVLPLVSEELSVLMYVHTYIELLGAIENFKTFLRFSTEVFSQKVNYALERTDFTHWISLYFIDLSK